MSVSVGDVAPEFELRDQHGQPVRLSDFRGKRNVVLVFYPFSFTRVCQGELCELRDDIGDFASDDVALLAVSVDSAAVQRQFAAEQGYEFPVLADFWPHGAVAQAYGVFDDRMGAARRGTFIIDRDGIVRWTTVNELREARNIDDYRKALADIG
jgi:peroxiredoxin